MRKKSIVNDNAKSTTSSAYQRGNNRDGSPHYVFLYSDDDDNDDADDDDDGGGDCDNSHDNYMEKIPLQLRKNRGEKNFYPRKVEVITVTLKAEDTLQALSLRYRCTISELKRINNIHKENEIFARRTVKVPVQPYSIFTEINKYDNEEKKQNEITNNTVEFFDVNNSIVDDKINNDEQQNIIIPSSTGNSNSNNSDNNDSNNINNIILNSLSIDPLRNNIENNDIEIDTSENDGLLLINERDRDSTPEGRIIELFGCSGADWGLTWIHLLGASVLFGFVLPVIYIVFITENQHKYTNNTNSI